MASVRVGVVSAAEVNGPLNSNGVTGPLFDISSGSTWSLLWFVFAVIVLFLIL